MARVRRKVPLVQGRAFPRALVGLSPAAAERALSDLERAYEAIRETRRIELESRVRQVEEEAALVQALELQIEKEAERIRLEMERMDMLFQAVQDRVARERRPMDLSEAKAAGRITELEIRLGELYRAGDLFRQGLRDALRRGTEVLERTNGAVGSDERMPSAGTGSREPGQTLSDVPAPVQVAPLRWTVR